MNYDALLSQLTNDHLDHTSVINASVSQGGAVEEEAPAAIQTVQRPPRSTTYTNPSVEKDSKSVTSTPQRKASTSSRFINAFQHFYAGSSSLSSNNTPANSTSLCPTSVTVEDQESSSNDSAGRLPTKGMESKLLSMWHNVKYGWNNKIKSNFSKEQPVWLLGRCYHRKSTPPSSMENSVELNAALLNNRVLASNAYDSIQNEPSPIVGSDAPTSTYIYPLLNPSQIEEIVVPQELGMDAVENQVADNPWEEGIEGFRRDFYSRLWMTYRREFPSMNGSNYTSDCGWGCMLRSGQMLLAQGLICHFLGRSWRYDPETQVHTTYEDNMHKKIIKWFGDSSSRSSPFSIHALVNLGRQMGKQPGDWYGPASVSYLLKQALKNASQENADFDNVIIYVAKDCTIYLQDVQDECCIREQKLKHDVPWKVTRKAEETKQEMEQHRKSVLVLIPLRLGTEKLNPVYAHCLKLLLSTEYCIGIIGGRPKHSLYFVGFQEDKLIHLDPHYCQEMVDVNQENFPVQSFHCKSPRKLKTAKMDPSCCIGFYCQTKADFDSFVESVQLYLHPMRCAPGTNDKIITSAQQSATDNLTGAQYTEMNYPLFTFSRGRCLDPEMDDADDVSPYQPLRRQLAEIQQEGNCTNVLDDDDGETEEFVLL